MRLNMVPRLLLPVLLTMVLWECLIVEAYGPGRRPKDGDSCRSYRFTGSLTQYMYQALMSMGGSLDLPCMQGTVVSSRGACVDPRSLEADRCQEIDGFNEAKVNEICRRYPTAKFADPLRCDSYYDCRYSNKHPICSFDPQSRTQLMFDDVDQVCKLSNEVGCGQRPVNYTNTAIEGICRRDSHRVFVDSDNCNSYYNCSQYNDPTGSLLPMFAGECPYLQLFDAETKTCRPYQQVQCHLRREIKNPCELRHMGCRTAHCRPCHLSNPDCTRLADGDQPLDYNYYSPKYVQCLQGRTLGVHECQPTVNSTGHVEARLFHPYAKECLPVTSVPRSLGGLGPDDY